MASDSVKFYCCYLVTHPRQPCHCQNSTARLLLVPFLADLRAASSSSRLRRAAHSTSTHVMSQVCVQALALSSGSGNPLQHRLYPVLKWMGRILGLATRRLLNRKNRVLVLRDTHILTVCFCPSPMCIFVSLLSGRPCDSEGNYLPLGTPPLPPIHPPLGDYSPFKDCAQFEIADFLYQSEQMSQGNINDLMQLWSATCPPDLGVSAPFAGTEHMHSMIDVSPLGGIPWQAFSVQYNGPLPEGDPPPWMTAENYDVWFLDPREILQNQLANQDFDGEMDYAARQVYVDGNKCEFTDFMMGNWAWRQSVRRRVPVFF